MPNSVDVDVEFVLALFAASLYCIFLSLDFFTVLFVVLCTCIKFSIFFSHVLLIVYNNRHYLDEVKELG